VGRRRPLQTPAEFVLGLEAWISALMDDSWPPVALTMYVIYSRLVRYILNTVPIGGKYLGRSHRRIAGEAAGTQKLGAECGVHP